MSKLRLVFLHSWCLRLRHVELQWSRHRSRRSWWLEPHTLMRQWFDMRCEDNIVCNFSRCFHKAPLMFPTSSVTWYKPDVNSFLFYGRSITHFVSGWRPTRFQCPPQSPWDQFGFWIGLDLGLESWGTLGLGTGLDWFHADYTEPRFCNFKDEELWT